MLIGDDQRRGPQARLNQVAGGGPLLEAVGDPGAVGWERAGMGLLPAGIAVSQPPPLFPRA